MSRLIDADKALETVHNQGSAHPNVIISRGLCTANMLLLIRRDLTNDKQNERCDGLTKWR